MRCGGIVAANVIRGIGLEKGRIVVEEMVDYNEDA